MLGTQVVGSAGCTFSMQFIQGSNATHHTMRTNTCAHLLSRLLNSVLSATFVNTSLFFSSVTFDVYLQMPTPSCDKARSRVVLDHI